MQSLAGPCTRPHQEFYKHLPGRGLSPPCMNHPDPFNSCQIEKALKIQFPFPNAYSVLPRQSKILSLSKDFPCVWSFFPHKGIWGHGWNVISSTEGMRESQGPGQGPAGTSTDFSWCKKLKLGNGNSSKFKIKLSTWKRFCLSSQSVYAPLHKNRCCSMGTSKHPLWTLTPATYHVHFQLNYLQSPSLKNKVHDFNPGILKEIFTFGLLQLHKSTYKGVFTNLGSDPNLQMQGLPLTWTHFGSSPWGFQLFFLTTAITAFSTGIDYSHS